MSFVTDDGRESICEYSFIKQVLGSQYRRFPMVGEGEVVVP